DYENIDVSEYVQDGDDEVADYKTRDDSYADDEQKQIPFKTEASFYETLLTQLGLLKLDDTQQKIAEQIVGSIDEDGYLRRETSAIVDDLAFRQNISATEKEVEEMIARIQHFDPPGVAARDLQECLLLQLQRQKNEGKNVDVAIEALEKYFDEFTKKHYEKIQRGLGIDEEELKEVMQQIIRLNPKPGGNVGGINKAESYVVPDFFIMNNGGKLELTLNSRNAPELRISEGYRDMMKEYDRGSKKDKRQKEAVLFIKQKIDAAKWFIDAIKQRQHTLISTMTAIMNHQHDFFITGDETNLRPMILKDIAEKTGLDISTVSRVANSKFVQTEFGTYRLKFFFSESLSTESGEEVSTREVKKILSDLIEGESKKHPLSDEKLTELLQEKGYNIARRTVAKYREQLNIPVARLRKEL
ncbi:MAG TPA: RNA polymerase factor sigma-54, partial [Chitinophagaceae bacterium]|nr:RNA polymerase factor sigma-54 [Chitinophagaceae bacterium]